MTWLDSYRSDLAELENTRLPYIDDSTIDEWKRILEPLLDGQIDDGDVETVVGRWMGVFKAQEVEIARKECAIHRTLSALYERLEQATDKEWEEYVRIRLLARCRGMARAFRRIRQGRPDSG